MNSSKLNLLVERLVKEEIRKTLLGEATFNINKDVDYIFNRAFKQFYADLFAGKKPYQSEVESHTTNIEFDAFDSTELPSITAQKANEVKPMGIFCGIYDNGSYYDPDSLAIYISINKKVLKMFYEDTNPYTLNLNMREIYRQSTETTSVIKSTIYHELSHWLRDSLNNSHISKMTNRFNTDIRAGKNSDSVMRKIKNQGLPHTYMTNYEIDALIHNIKQFKRDMSEDEWNSLSLAGMIRTIPAISIVYKDISKKYMDFQGSSEEIRKPSWRKDWAGEFVKMLIKRMNREGLLGDYMKNTDYISITRPY